MTMMPAAAADEESADEPLARALLPHPPRRYLMSAKSGDQVASAFERIAAALAGVTLSKPEVEASQRVVSAQIVNHARHDPDVAEGKVPEYTKPKNAQCCVS